MTAPRGSYRPHAAAVNADIWPRDSASPGQ